MVLDFDTLRRKHHTFIPQKFGFDCQTGWIEILDTLFSTIDSILAADTQFRLLQVKEKFGGLRIRFRIEPEPAADVYWRLRRQIDIAEALSFHVCEHCGRAGSLMNRDGFYFTAC